MEPDDETAVSEITILQDGRVFVLGASRQVLEILEVLSPEDAGLKQRLEHAGGEEARSARVSDPAENGDRRSPALLETFGPDLCGVRRPSHSAEVTSDRRESDSPKHRGGDLA